MLLLAEFLLSHLRRGAVVGAAAILLRLFWWSVAQGLAPQVHPQASRGLSTCCALQDGELSPAELEMRCCDVDTVRPPFHHSPNLHPCPRLGVCTLSCASMTCASPEHRAVVCSAVQVAEQTCSSTWLQVDELVAALRDRQVL